MQEEAFSRGTPERLNLYLTAYGGFISLYLHLPTSPQVCPLKLNIRL
jgi:hypothetical protein